MNEFFNSFLDAFLYLIFFKWWDDSPTIGYLFCALIFFAGPEKAIKLWNDYCRTVRRIKIRLIRKGWWIKPKHPILLVESWENIDMKQGIAYYTELKIPRKSLDENPFTETLYDVWINYESLQKTRGFNDSVWEYIEEISPETQDIKSTTYIIFRERFLNP